MRIVNMLAQTSEHLQTTLQPGGWMVMLLSVGFVTLLLAWCIWRVMRESSAAKVHSQIEETPDVKR